MDVALTLPDLNALSLDALKDLLIAQHEKYSAPRSPTTPSTASKNCFPETYRSPVRMIRPTQPILNKCPHKLCGHTAVRQLVEEIQLVRGRWI